VNLRRAYLAAGLGFVLLVAAIAAFGLGAPTVVGALLLLAMVACGVIYFALVARASSRFKAAARAGQPQRAPWEDR
jgi:hypothetical protein